jgi:hypothetical protein
VAADHLRRIFGKGAYDKAIQAMEFPALGTPNDGKGKAEAKAPNVAPTANWASVVAKGK